MDQFLAAFKPAQAAKKVVTEEEKRKTLPWVEKYRPKTIADLVSQEEVTAVLKRSIADYNLPNLLFYGPPGTGKTSAILAAARELFGHELYRDRVLELNASDERGIAVVRQKIKVFSELTASGKRADGRPCPPFKVVILDEADSMTSAAQAALRRTMERQCRTTRFCLICNYVTRIIDPITSRCAKFRFRPLPAALAVARLREICAAEGLAVREAGDSGALTVAALERVVAVCEGDLRRAVTLAQGLARVESAGGAAVAFVDEMAGVVPQEWMERLWDAIRSGAFERVQRTVEEMLLNGFSAYQCIVQLHDDILAIFQMEDQKKSEILEKIAECDGCLIDGADEYLQLMSLCSLILRQMQ